MIDDDATVRDMMRHYLSRNGFDVLVAKGGAQGLEMARTQKPSVITLDVLMPGMDGWSVLQQLKADPALASITVIMLTILDEAERGYTLGASEVMTKPIDREHLHRSIERHSRPGHDLDILIVEDHSAARDSLRRALVGYGWSTREASNGKQGLEGTRRAQPDRVLLDLLMLEMDVFELLTAVREIHGLEGLPIIVITGADLSAEERERLMGGVAHH